MRGAYRLTSRRSCGPARSANSVLVVASDGVWLLYIVWFTILTAVLIAYRRDARGWLTRVVEQHFDAAQQAAFDESQSGRTRAFFGGLDRAEIRDQQRRIATFGIVFSVALLVACAAKLAL